MPRKAAVKPEESPKKITMKNKKKKLAMKPAGKALETKLETVLTTIVQAGGQEYDITGITEKAYKAYKSVHKRKHVTEFKVYVKPEEGVAYYTVNGEGAEDFKIDLNT